VEIGAEKVQVEKKNTVEGITANVSRAGGAKPRDVD